MSTTLDTEQTEMVETAVARWADYEPVFAAIARRLTISRAEAVAFCALIFSDGPPQDPDDESESWRQPA
ncbi:MAG: hypothetical protein DMD60_05140 [Gemmatimonadetes bacterium]|nr:MAG: hypothetical protein DMD60_05140 [Gemmatimonadota bacterium]